MRKIIFILLWCLPMLSWADQPAMITGMRISPSVNKTILIFNLTAPTSGSVKFFPDDNSLVLTFSHAKLRFKVNQAKLVNANIVEFSAKELADDRVLWRFKTTGKVTWTTSLTPKAGSVEMQLEVNSSAPVSAPAPVTPAIEKPAAVTPAKVSSTKIKSRLFTVVIDAGHGGKDSGAVSKNGIREKDVVLAIAKKMASKLGKVPGVRVILTRNGDYYVPLRGRLSIARRDTADLFIAVHADAYFNNVANGASVYALSQHGATNEASRWLARQENYSEIDGIDFDRLPDRSRMLRSVLIDLSQTATIRDSLHLGNKVLDAMDNVTSLHYRRVEQAPFVVLKSPDIPSILVETGFVSNPREAAQLANPGYQDKLAHALCQGVKNYIKQYAALPASG